MKFVDDNYLEECIISSLVILMKNKPYEKITMSMVAKKSGVSRRTIYRYFKNKQDIVKKYIANLKNEYLKFVASNLNSGKTIVQQSFEFVSVNFDFFKIANSNNVLFDVQQILEDIIREVIKFSKDKIQLTDKTYVNYLVSYIAAGCLSILTKWINGNQNETPEQMYEYYKLIAKDLYLRHQK